MEPWEPIDPSDATLIINTLFEIKAKLIELGDDVTTIRRMLEGLNGNGEEELP